MARTPEGRVKDIVKNVLVSLRAWYFFPAMNGMGRAGIPDIVAALPVVITQDMVGTEVALFCGVECKADGGKVTALQARELEAIRQAKGLAVVVTGELEARSLAKTLAGTGVLAQQEKVDD